MDFSASTMRSASASDLSASPPVCESTIAERARSTDTFFKSCASMGLPWRTMTRVPSILPRNRVWTSASMTSFAGSSANTTICPPPSDSFARMISSIISGALSVQPRITLWPSSRTSRPILSWSIFSRMTSTTRPSTVLM